MLKIRTFATRLSLALAALVLTAAATSAAPLTLPPGLNPGDQYRLAFITSDQRNATATDIAVYNSFVSGAANAVAELAALGTTWSAIASTGGTSARDNTSTVFGSDPDAPIYLLDGVKVADGNLALWGGSLDAAITITETGSTYSGLEFVWTGTDSLGTGAFGEWLGSLDPVSGRLFETDGDWINQSISFPPGVSLSLYGLSGVLTVATVHEPAPVAVLAMSLAVLTVSLRRQRRGRHSRRLKS
jgi:hypothetical protein